MTSSTADIVDDFTTPDETLCPPCRLIDFKNALDVQLKPLSFLSSKNNHKHITKLGQWRHSKEKTACQLCQAFHNALKWTDADVEAELWDIYLLPSPLMRNLENSAHEIVSPTQTAWIKLIPVGSIVDLSYLSAWAIYTGWLSCQSNHTQPGMFKTQLVAPRWKPSAVQTWLRICQQHHSQHCNVSEASADLALIDCQTMKICSAPSRAKYVALSYVWKKGPTQQPISTRQDMSKLALPQTMIDSIEVTRELGYRYLWVDKYCINQQDPVVQLRQIESMSAVYGNAEITIIAAEGDEEHGLEGVSRFRNVSSLCSLGDATLIWIPPTAEGLSSDWTERAWTFQEELLSRRRLYFDRGQLHFVCQEMACCESLGGLEHCDDVHKIPEYSLIFERALGVLKVSDIVRQIKLKDVTEPSPTMATEKPSKDPVARRLWNFMDIISDYSERKLTYDADALRAFSGVQRVFQGGSYPIYSLQGLPLLLYNLSGRDCFSTNLMLALCWHSEDPVDARRRSQFPSWTWAGWTNGVTYSFRMSPSYMGNYVDCSEIILFEYEDARKLTVWQLFDELGSSHMLESTQTSNNHSTKTLAEHRLQLTTPQLLLPIIIHMKACLINVSAFSCAVDEDWATCFFLKIFSLDKRDAYFSKRNLPFTPRYLLDGLRVGDLGCILLRFDGSAHGTDSLGFYKAHMMLVNLLGDGRATRFGDLTAILLSEAGTEFDFSEIHKHTIFREIALH